ncbi:unannotated protein [freshwater metagenome]|uniref:Unannotated protein n=1 Tax=freshwater metagenome TaxID=449393 RepID=A0A6J6Q239_9ZZZZ
MNAVEYARPSEKRAEDGETKCGHQQRQVPHSKHSSAFLHEHRVDVCRCSDPRQERRIFNWVPRPHTAPAKHLVTPPSTKNDADGEKPPGKQCPTTCCKQPSFANPARNQSSDCKCEGNCHAYITQIQHRRMEHDEQVILQKWVRAGAVDNTGSAYNKWVCWAEGKQEEK